MNFLPELKAAWKDVLPAKMAQCALAAILSLHLYLPALAEKIEGVQSAKISHPENSLIIAAFTILNYVAGIAILAAVVFCGIWFFQRKSDIEDEDEVVETEVFTAAEPAAPTSAAAPAESPAETPARAEPPADDKPLEAQAQEPAVKEIKVEEVTVEEGKSDEAKVEEAKSDENHAEEPKSDDIKVEAVKVDEAAADGQSSPTKETSDKGKSSAAGKKGKNKKS